MLFGWYEVLAAVLWVDTGKKNCLAAILPVQHKTYKDDLLLGLILFYVSVGKHTLRFLIKPSALVLQAAPRPVDETTHLWNLRFHINDNSIAALQGIDAAGTTAIINSCKEAGQTVNKPIREERVTWLDAFTVIKQLKAFKLVDVRHVLLPCDV